MAGEPTTVPSGTRVRRCGRRCWRSGNSANCRWSIKQGRPVGLVDVTDVVGSKAEAERLRKKPAEKTPASAANVAEVREARRA